MENRGVSNMTDSNVVQFKGAGAEMTLRQDQHRLLEILKAGSLTDSRGYNLRVPMAQGIRLRFEGQSGFVKGVLSNLSVGGMAVQCGFEAAVGSMLRFVFQAPGSTVEVKGQGSVLWTRPSTEAVGKQAGLTALGVKFVSLAEVDREAVARIATAGLLLKAKLEQADAKPGEEEGAPVEKKLREVLDSLAEAKAQLQETTFLWEAAELRVEQLSKSQEALERELEKARKAAPDSEGKTPDSEGEALDSEGKTPDSEGEAPDSEGKTPDSEGKVTSAKVWLERRMGWHS